MVDLRLFKMEHFQTQKTPTEKESPDGLSFRPVCDTFRFQVVWSPNVWSYPTFPPSIKSELFYTDAAKTAALGYVKETVMGPQIDRMSSRVPRRFPVGAKYVVEGYGGEKGNLRVIARYVVLPGGRRINVPDSLSQPASPAGPPHSGPILSDPRMADHVR
jgi:hypothetical protein